MGLGFMAESSGKNYCTIAGLVLFGKAPRKFLRQAGLRVFGFDSENKEYKALFDEGTSKKSLLNSGEDIFCQFKAEKAPV